MPGESASSTPGSVADERDAELVKALCENVQDYLCIVDSERRIRWTNRLHASLTAEQVIGVALDEFLCDEAREIVSANFAKVVATGVPATYVICNDYFGEERWLEHRLISVKHLDGTLLLITRDITAERRAQIASTESMDLAQNLIADFPDVILLMKPDGVVIDTNDLTAGSLGTTREELIGRVAWAQMPPEVRERRQRYAAQVCQTKGPVRRTDDNGGRIFDSVGYPIKTSNGQVQAIVVISRDVTEQSRAEEMLRQKQARQWHAEKMQGLGALAAGISHDFNNLLTPIIVNASQAAMADCSPDRRSALLASVLEAADRATKLIQQIMVYGSDGKSEVRVHDICETVNNTVDFMSLSLAADVTIEATIPAEAIWARVDEVQFNQALINLCINAGQAMASRGGIVKIVVRAHSGSDALPKALGPGPHVCISVSDTGDGMDESILPQIFTPFYSTKSPDQGSGLGLFVVHSVAANHSGTITVESVMGKGTTFDLWLPRVAVGEALARPMGVVAEPEVLASQRILLLEDDSLVRESATLILEGAANHVTPFTNCRDAWCGFQEDPAAFDIAILDQRLGDGSGLDVALKLRALRPGLPVVLCSGHITADVRQVCDANGLAMLVKPYWPRQLLQAVANARVAVEAELPRCSPNS